MDYQFDFSVVHQNWDFLLSGLLVTLKVTSLALFFASIMGLVVGVMRVSKSWFIRAPAAGFIAVLRNTPTLVQLIWVYYCLPILSGHTVTPVAAAIIALSLTGGAYLAEIVKGGIEGVDSGQVEAAGTIGLSDLQTMLYVILPQALRRMVAPFVNEFVTLLKFSSLASILGVAELTYTAQALSASSFRPIETFTFLGLEYFVLCSVLSYVAKKISSRYATPI
ncbi:amino acid ABC transporter permease [Achromobacter xylosoxidans]|uniref:amino acid ABC transporter permease n=1 Tax=Alcaligenes xylosoxydans xylosoxydans TaxID=85698 RepID=UPI0012DE812C|nr:amino acid ABC transporter permease [Achromobacter xylosoxidans]